MIARASTVPRVVPTYRQGDKVLSPLRAKVSPKWKLLMASRASLSMLVTLEERERLKELSRWSNGFAPRGGHTDRRTVGRKAEKGKAPAQQHNHKTDNTDVETLPNPQTQMTNITNNETL